MRLASVILLLPCLSLTLHAQEGPAKEAPDRPLVTHIATFDASAHAFGGHLYVYVSHDTEARMPDRNAGQRLRHYHLLRLDSASAPARDLGPLAGTAAGSMQGVGPAVGAAAKGRYFIYFPVQDRAGARRICVAQSAAPEGPFRPAAAPVFSGEGTDPAAFRDEDGRQYIYFTGPQGLMVARLRADMQGVAETPQKVVVNDSNGALLPVGDQSRRFAAGAWVHKQGERYYLSYSTGNSHRLVYATARNPYGPFTYRGVLLPPVAGWTTRASVVPYRGRWYLFYHECGLSEGSPVRSVKMAEIRHDPHGGIRLRGHGS